MFPNCLEVAIYACLLLHSWNLVWKQLWFVLAPLINITLLEGNKHNMFVHSTKGYMNFRNIYVAYRSAEERGTPLTHSGSMTALINWPVEY